MTVAEALADLATAPELASAPKANEIPIPESPVHVESLVEMVRLLATRRGDPVQFDGVSNLADRDGDREAERRSSAHQ
jgi:hypothetical protein